MNNKEQHQKAVGNVCERQYSTVDIHGFTEHRRTAAEEKTVCGVCPRHCTLAEGQAGFCRARAAFGGKVQCVSYGKITALALDPIEKKPLARFKSGSMVLSAGSFGCNLDCYFCQNHDISQSGPMPDMQDISPKELAQKAKELENKGNIGLAFTYNEPAVGWEFVRDAAFEAKALGLSNVMVTNGCFAEEVLAQLLPLIDAFNIDLKCFTEEGYKSIGGDLETVKSTIEKAAKSAHVEVTTLVVPALSDGEEDMRRQAEWLSAISPDIPLHISRYFPRWKAAAPPTPLAKLQALEEIAKESLNYVYLGNC